MKLLVSFAVLAVGSALGFRATPGTDQDTRRHVDALGVVYASSGSARGGAFFEAAGNPGFVVQIRNWDTTRPIKAISGLVGFSPNSATRVTGASASKATATGDPRGTVQSASVDERGMIQIPDLALQPAETLTLYVTLSATPTAPYGFSFEAQY